MASPPSSPDLHPPAYLQPSSSPPPLPHHHYHYHRKYRSPQSSPSNLFLPLPAVTSYAYAPSKSAYDLQRSPLQQLQNQSRRLTTELQQLLDAQSTALLSPISAATSAATATNTRKKALPLPAARTGILTAMSELSDVKSRESALYHSLSISRRELLATVSHHRTKTSRLHQELAKIHASPDALAADNLRSESAAVAAEIAALRRRLADLESRHASMRTELAALDNVVDARAASYQAALDTLSRRTAAFLAERKQAAPETAAEAWEREAEAYEEQRGAAEREREALEEGMRLWEEAMRAVCGFEERLRGRMVEDPGLRGGRAKREVRMELDKVVGELEEMVEHAEKEGWRLLIVAIGAELQAFREGGELLKKNLLVAQEDEGDEGGEEDLGDDGASDPGRLDRGDFPPLDK